jgi:hypothetical protein
MHDTNNLSQVYHKNDLTSPTLDDQVRFLDGLFARELRKYKFPLNLVNNLKCKPVALRKCLDSHSKSENPALYGAMEDKCIKLEISYAKNKNFIFHAQKTAGNSPGFLARKQPMYINHDNPKFLNTWMLKFAIEPKEINLVDLFAEYISLSIRYRFMHEGITTPKIRVTNTLNAYGVPMVSLVSKYLNNFKSLREYKEYDLQNVSGMGNVFFSTFLTGDLDTHRENIGIVNHNNKYIFAAVDGGLSFSYNKYLSFLRQDNNLTHNPSQTIQYIWFKAHDHPVVESHQNLGELIKIGDDHNTNFNPKQRIKEMIYRDKMYTDEMFSSLDFAGEIYTCWKKFDKNQIRKIVYFCLDHISSVMPLEQDPNYLVKSFKRDRRMKFLDHNHGQNFKLYLTNTIMYHIELKAAELKELSIEIMSSIFPFHAEVALESYANVKGHSLDFNNKRYIEVLAEKGVDLCDQDVFKYGTWTQRFSNNFKASFLEKENQRRIQSSQVFKPTDLGPCLIS